ncbi:MAG: hypothetical protein AAB383_01785 [Patescibacteria group bacterium]
MNPNFFIKYRGTNSESDSEIDLGTLGDSIVGFNSVIKEVFSISKIQGELKVTATELRQGSLIVDIILKIFVENKEAIFKTIPDLLDYLKVIDVDACKRAIEFFNTSFDIGADVHQKMNAYASKYPADYDLIKLGLGSFVLYLLKKAKTQKQRPDLNELPSGYAVKVHNMIRRRKFKRALKPFIDDEVSTIEISADRQFRTPAKIDTENFDKYLSESEVILPNYIHGRVYKFKGTIVSMQCSHGDSMKLRVIGLPQKDRDLVAFPPDGSSTRDFDQYYGETVSIDALIERRSLYQKPKLHIQHISLNQESFI